MLYKKEVGYGSGFYWAGGEIADTLPLGGSAARHGGASPLPPTERDKPHI